MAKRPADYDLTDGELIEKLRELAWRSFSHRETALLEELIFRAENRARIIENYPSDMITD